MRLITMLTGAVLAAGMFFAVPAHAAHKSVGRRLAHQQARINRLERTGRISPRTAARMQAQHNRMVAEAMTHRNRHGRVRKATRRHLQHQLNHSSARISHHHG